MTDKTIGQCVEVLCAWAEEHDRELIEVILVGSQAPLREDAALRAGSDIDVVVVVTDDADQRQLLATLAAVGLQHKVLFHPLLMTSKERRDKLRMPHYGEMMSSGHRIYPG